MKTARILSMAAAVMLIVTVGITALFINNYQQYSSMGLYSLSMEELTANPAAGTSIYDVQKIQELRAIVGE